RADFLNRGCGGAEAERSEEGRRNQRPFHRARRGEQEKQARQDLSPDPDESDSKLAVEMPPAAEGVSQHASDDHAGHAERRGPESIDESDPADAPPMDPPEKRRDPGRPAVVDHRDRREPEVVTEEGAPMGPEVAEELGRGRGTNLSFGRHRATARLP